MTPPSIIDGYKFFPTGSRYVCDPPAVGTDADFAVLAEVTDGNKKPFTKIMRTLVEDNWMLGGSDVGDGSGDGLVQLPQGRR
jgi:hypothetical protein